MKKIMNLKNFKDFGKKVFDLEENHGFEKKCMDLKNFMIEFKEKSSRI